MSWGFRYFREEEFDHPEKMHPELLARLDHARVQAGVPFVITSDYRPDLSPENDDDDSAHELGKAVDIRAHYGRYRWRIVKAAIHAGFTRIGVYDHHVHLDIATEEEGYPQGVLWVGKSR